MRRQGSEVDGGTQEAINVAVLTALQALGPGISATAAAQALNGMATQVSAAVTAALPGVLSDANPIAEATVAAPGSTAKAARIDHIHPKRSQIFSGNLNSSGEATLTFAKPLAAKPGMYFGYEEAADSQPVALRRKSWVMGAGADVAKYAGAIIRGTKPNTTVTPTSQVVALVTVLTQVQLNTTPIAAAGVAYDCLILEQA